MLASSRSLSLLLLCYVLFASLALGVEDDRLGAADSGELPIDVIRTNKATGTTARIPWDSPMFSTLLLFRRNRIQSGLSYGRLVFLIKDLKYAADEPRSNAVFITSDFRVNHGVYYYLTDSPQDDRRHELLFDDAYDMTDKASVHRTFVGVTNTVQSAMANLLSLYVPEDVRNTPNNAERPSIDEEKMTYEKFIADYRDVRKGERDFKRESEKFEKLAALEEEYRDQLPEPGIFNSISLEYYRKQQQIEDEYLASLELQLPLEQTRPLSDKDLLDSFESLSPEAESAIYDSQVVEGNWAYDALAEAVRRKYIAPGEEFSAFALELEPADPPVEAEDGADP